jgi:hypothetical protein
MQWIVPVGCILFLFMLSCGCIQFPPAAPVTPAGGSGVTVEYPTDTIATPEPLRQVNITATKTVTEVIVLVNGGKNAATLASMDIRITNYDGTVNTRTVSPVVIGKPYTFTYRGNANAARINIIGTFSDGYQQTLLMTFL